MGLRQIAEQDLGLILEDKDTGFGYDIVITDPAGTVVPLVGFSNDISQLIDPDTGQAVSGRFATVALRIAPILAAGVTLPRGIAEALVRPWLVQFDGINGFPFTFKVSSSDPDRSIGIITLTLEIYNP